MVAMLCGWFPVVTHTWQGETRLAMLEADEDAVEDHVPVSGVEPVVFVFVVPVHSVQLPGPVTVE